jgi:hypothetical protein
MSQAPTSQQIFSPIPSSENRRKENTVSPQIVIEQNEELQADSEHRESKHPPHPPYENYMVMNKFQLLNEAARKEMECELIKRKIKAKELEKEALAAELARIEIEEEKIKTGGVFKVTAESYGERYGQVEYDNVTDPKTVSQFEVVMVRKERGVSGEAVANRKTISTAINRVKEERADDAVDKLQLSIHSSEADFDQVKEGGAGSLNRLARRIADEPMFTFIDSEINALPDPRIYEVETEADLSFMRGYGVSELCECD